MMPCNPPHGLLKLRPNAVRSAHSTFGVLKQCLPHCWQAQNALELRLQLHAVEPIEKLQASLSHISSSVAALASRLGSEAAETRGGVAELKQWFDSRQVRGRMSDICEWTHGCAL